MSAGTSSEPVRLQADDSGGADSSSRGLKPVELDLLRIHKRPEPQLLVSACLAGRRCRYDGTDRRDERIAQMVEKGEAIAVCPEESVGLPIPRPPAEIVGGDGVDVLAGRARVVQFSGKDITELVVKGAQKTLATARKKRITRAILKANSPSCGAGQIYDGTCTGTLRPGMGVTAALLAENGIEVCDEASLD